MEGLVAQFSSDLSTAVNVRFTFPGAATTLANAVAVDGAGNVYVAGQTTTPDGIAAAFALKMNADLSQTFWKVTSDRYVGGPANGAGIVVSRDGNDVWVTGSLGVGGRDLALLVAHLNGTDGTLRGAAAYRFGFGDTGDSEGYGVAVNGAGRVYVAGYFFDDSTSTAGNQALVALFNPDLSFAAGVGVPNPGDDRATGIVLDPGGNPHVTGFLNDGNPADPTKSDLLYGRFDPGLSTANVYSLPAAASLVGKGIALNAANEPLLVGGTDDHVNPDALLVRLSATLPPQVLDYYTFGGSSADVGNDIATAPDGVVYVGGTTSSDDFPTTPGAFQETYGGGPSDGFVTRLGVS
jgi:hypothetical protein